MAEQSSGLGHHFPGPAASNLSQAGQAGRSPSILLILTRYYAPDTDLSAGDLSNV